MPDDRYEPAYFHVYLKDVTRHVRTFASDTRFLARLPDGVLASLRDALQYRPATSYDDDMAARHLLIAVFDELRTRELQHSFHPMNRRQRARFRRLRASHQHERR